MGRLLAKQTGGIEFRSLNAHKHLYIAATAHKHLGIVANTHKPKHWGSWKIPGIHYSGCLAKLVNPSPGDSVSIKEKKCRE